MMYVVEMPSYGVIFLPKFINIYTGVHANVRFSPRQFERL
jgi:hypothetical protein